MVFVSIVIKAIKYEEEYHISNKFLFLIISISNKFLFLIISISNKLFLI